MWAGQRKAGQVQSEQYEWNQAGRKSPAVELGLLASVAEAAEAA